MPFLFDFYVNSMPFIFNFYVNSMPFFVYRLFQDLSFPIGLFGPSIFLHVFVQKILIKLYEKDGRFCNKVQLVHVASDRSMCTEP